MMFRRTPLVLLAAAVVALSGCSHANADDDGVATEGAAPSTAGDFPTLHLEQTAVMLYGGKPQEESNYRKDLADCRKAGTTTTPIADTDVGKIGRRHVTRTVEAIRSSERTQEWSVELPAPCQFRLAEKDNLVINTPDGKSYAIDQLTHKGDVQDIGAPQPPEPIRSDAQEDAVAKATGWNHTGDEASAGQSCAIWAGPDQQLCVWNKGEPWGYTRMHAGLDDGLSPGDAIVLWAKPGQGTGWQLQTEVFTVGKSLGETPFQVPADATLSTAD